MVSLRDIIKNPKEGLKAVGRDVAKALDLTAAVAKNPLAILSPSKSAESIKQLRTDIASGDKEKAISYIKTVGVQTALNVGAVAAGAGALGSAAKSAATSIGGKAIKVGVVAAPLIVGSSTIRDVVASTSPVEIGVKAGEKLEKAIKQGDEKALSTANIVGTLASGATGAALALGAEKAIDYFKNKKEDVAFQPIGATPVASTMPIAAETTNVTRTSSTKSKRKKRKKQVQQIPNINIRIDNRDDWDRNIYKGGRSR